MALTTDHRVVELFHLATSRRDDGDDGEDDNDDDDDDDDCDSRGRLLAEGAAAKPTLPRRVVAVDGCVKTLAVGEKHAVAITSSGQAFAWGLNAAFGRSRCRNISKRFRMCVVV